MVSTRKRAPGAARTIEEVRRLPSATDWTRVAAMSDGELTANAEADPDNGPIPEVMIEGARPMRLEDFLTAAKEKVSLRLDREVLSWFRAQGGGYQTRINAALKAYISAQKRPSPPPSNT